MNIKQIGLLISILFIFENCSVNEKLKKYEEFKKGVRSEVFNKFPIKENKEIVKCSILIFVYPDASEYLGYCGMSVVFDYIPERFLDMVDSLQRKKIALYDDNDKFKLLIPDTTINDYSKCKGNYYPIPNLYSQLFLDNKEDLLSKNNLKYYVLDCKEGKFLKDYNFSKKPKILINSKLNATFKNGFSNGAIVDFNKNRIVYWILIW